MLGIKVRASCMLGKSSTTAYTEVLRFYLFGGYFWCQVLALCLVLDPKDLSHILLPKIL
jgi:hypothetical protein